MLVADTAIIDPQAEIAEGVKIGPYSVIGPHVRLGTGCRILNHVTFMGHVEMGEDNLVYPYAVLGGEPQDLSYRGTPTRVVIGSHNTIREGVTVNRGTEKEDGVTEIGSHNLLMAFCHIAHDCRLGNHIAIANNTIMGGHVHIHDHANISGAVAIHHFVTIGEYAFIGGMARIVKDIPPYMMIEGHPGRPRCVNVVGLKRHGFTEQEIKSLEETHRLLYRARMGLNHARELLERNGYLSPRVQRVLEFRRAQDDGRNGRARERITKP